MKEERIKCPHCSEQILADAMKCRFCREWLEPKEKPTKDAGPQENFGSQACDQEENHKGEVEEAKGESPDRKPAKKSESKSKKKRHPWLRIVLVIAYLGIIVALVRSELNAQQILRDAQAKENAQDYQAAFESYQDIIEAFPFSFAIIETQKGIRRLCDSHDFKTPRPSWLLPVEDVLSRKSNVCDVNLLPLVVWPACAVLLSLVFLTRILRPSTAFLVLMLVVVSIAGSVAQLSWHGRMLSMPVAKGLMERPVVIYCASYLLLVVTALMTLTATRKRRSRNNDEQVDRSKRTMKCVARELRAKLALQGRK